MSRLTNYEKKELARLLVNTTEPFFKAIELTNTRETQGPRTALVYVLWEHLAWLWCPDTKSQLKDPGKIFRLFSKEFLLVQPPFKAMLDEFALDLDALWFERNKQLHSGRMMPHPTEQSNPSARNIFHCDGDSTYADLFRSVARSARGRRYRAALIDLTILCRSLKRAADALQTRLLVDPSRGRVALQRLRLRGSARVGDIVQRHALKKVERLRELVRGGARPELFPMPQGSLRIVFAGGEVVEFSAAEMEAFPEWCSDGLKNGN